MQNAQKRPLYYLPVVLFVAVIFGLGAVAVVAAVRSYEYIPDLVIKIITGWAGLVMALFGPFVIVVMMWGGAKTRNKKLTGFLFALLGLAATVWLVRYALMSMF